MPMFVTAQDLPGGAAGLPLWSHLCGITREWRPLWSASPTETRGIDEFFKTNFKNHENSNFASKKLCSR